MVRTTSLKNKTYEEIYGIERAKIMKERKRIKSFEWHEKNKNTGKYKKRNEKISLRNKEKLPVNKLNLPKKEIIGMYLDENISGTKIAKIFNCCCNTIYRVLKENNIEIKGNKFFNKGNPSKLRLFKDESKIIDMYVNKDIPGNKIAKKFDCSLPVIYGILNRNKIKIKGVKYFNKDRKASEETIRKLKNNAKTNPNYGMKNKHHSRKTKEIMKIKKLGKPQFHNRRKDVNQRKEEILDLYSNQNNSIFKISKIIGCSERIIERILKEKSIKIRPQKDYMKGKHFSKETEFKKGHKETKEVRNKRIKNLRTSLNIKPNKPEQFLIGLIKKNNIPFNYVGDGKVILGGFNPDFLSKNPKHIIELFGDYWHNLPLYIKRDERRLKTYSKLGYRTLVIWEHELKNSHQVLNKIKEFIK